MLLHQVGNTNVFLIDTPGFDDPKVSDAKISNMITECLVRNFRCGAEIHGALYLHPVTEARMKGSGLKNLMMFKMMLGDKSLAHCRLVTTKWSLEKDRSVSEERERELCEKDKYWGQFIELGAQPVRFEDSMQSAIDIIKPLVLGTECVPLVVDEVVTKGLKKSETTVGLFASDNVEDVHKATAADREVARLEIRRAQEKGDLKWAQKVKELEAQYSRDLERMEDDMQNLRQHVQPLSGSEGGSRVGRWIARGVAAVAGTVITVATAGLGAPAAAMIYGSTEAFCQANRRS